VNFGIPLNLWTKFDELLVQAILGNQNFSFFVAGEQLNWLIHSLNKSMIYPFQA
jgi:hypothetical protein